MELKYIWKQWIKIELSFLKIREYTINYLKICGTNSDNMPIYFKFDEQCSVNYISYSLEFESKFNEKCLEITSSYFLK